MLISDYCCGEGEGSEEFKAYVAQRQYDLRTVKVRMEHTTDHLLKRRL